MKTRLPLPEREIQTRIDATDPTQDAWVSANAGSGKTHILRNRVLRLLLTGTPPDRILCLTYTRAAAAEMQARIFAELGAWVTLPDAALDEALGRLVSIRPEAFSAGERLREVARGLFARAIEAPGGLKVQTIHAFAERLLHLFPLEAGVPLDFSVLPDAEAADLRVQARRDAIEAAVAAPQSGLGHAFAALLDALDPLSFAKLMDEALAALSRLRLNDGALPETGQRVEALRKALKLGANDTAARFDEAFLAGLSPMAFDNAGAVLLGQKKVSDPQRKLAQKLSDLAQALASGTAAVDAVQALFLTGELAPRKNVLPAKLKADHPDLETFEEEAKAACLARLERHGALHTLERSHALTTFAEAVHARYNAAKAARGVMDFDDLIAALRHLLADQRAAWVLYKLDGGIDHVLIDEAQDTTRAMWDIVSALTEEFFAGEGVRKSPRTLFAVGDEKQSIYSFQGADPLVFDESRRHFAARSPRPALLLNPVRLTYSFRSSQDVLDGVDDAFRPEENRHGLSAGGEAVEHISADRGFPGHVELWPPARAISKEEAPGAQQAAEAVAATIKGWLEAPEHHLVDGRPIRPGDILVLVRVRNAFFEAVRKALQGAGVPVAGADRLTLQNEIVIQDLISLATALLTPGDDLALAEVLRSPIGGFDEGALETLARHRPSSLRAALVAAGHPLAGWLEVAGEAARRQGPFAFFCALLSAPAPLAPAKSLRACLKAALGAEIEDALNAFLNEALLFEQEQPHALLPFVLVQRQRQSQLKRDAEGAEDKVRVMSVHGAKGLEARIVFLCDAHGTPSRNAEDKLLMLERERHHLMLWSGLGRAEEPALMSEARADRRATLMGEYRRLLYVGMTRAADRLYVVSHDRELSKEEIKQKQEKSETVEDPLEASWYQLLKTGLTRARPSGEAQVLHPDIPARQRLSMQSAEPAAPPLAAKAEVRAEPALPDWARVALPPEQAEAVISPSAGSRATASGGQVQPFAQARGIVLHKLFELLPGLAPEARAAAGERLLTLMAPELAADERPALLAPVLAILAGEIGARHFGPASRAEVGLSGAVTLADGTARLVRGRIDRLSVSQTCVEVLDLKTGRPRPAAQDAAILRQMALYRALLARLYPDRAILCHVLWLESATLETLETSVLDAAFAGVQAQDPRQAGDA